jgi:hypothetical protein
VPSQRNIRKPRKYNWQRSRWESVSSTSTVVDWSQRPFSSDDESEGLCENGDNVGEQNTSPSDDGNSVCGSKPLTNNNHTAGPKDCLSYDNSDADDERKQLSGKNNTKNVLQRAATSPADE